MKYPACLLEDDCNKKIEYLLELKIILTKLRRAAFWEYG